MWLKNVSEKVQIIKSCVTATDHRLSAKCTTVKYLFFVTATDHAAVFCMTINVSEHCIVLLCVINDLVIVLTMVISIWYLCICVWWGCWTICMFIPIQPHTVWWECISFYHRNINCAVWFDWITGLMFHFNITLTSLSMPE